MPEFWESLFQEMTSKLMLKLKDVEKRRKNSGEESNSWQQEHNTSALPFG